ncbi:hypothetical protein Y032_0063g3442 [Ancylostoma ceylanicum]|nr:hypothetical protein Y032_0063g3442 [Ancylostoma ceylanicum]
MHSPCRKGRRIADCACGFLASRLQNRCETYSILSLGACSLSIPRSGSAAMGAVAQSNYLLRRSVMNRNRGELTDPGQTLHAGLVTHNEDNVRL